MSRVLRCAIYTRKSSEEGLEQDFNSLDAQREACEAYVRSQSHEGWKCLSDRYDDGGHSGGSLERPALQSLLEAVRSRRIDVIVIYKIDRLTRSLADFARLAELFEQNSVSFVSVTQQFNTTTSMGRLMLNVLLSFAQFEREITGERIRDKIAASKKKGMWMGGAPPLGYDAKDRGLVINPQEAETIKTIFSLYLELGTVAKLETELANRSIKTKLRSLSNGRIIGGRPISRGHLYKLLSNPIYVGRIPHKRESHPGLHERIIDQATWNAVQVKLADNTQGPRRRYQRGIPDGGMLAGILVDKAGNRFTLDHASKKGRRYRYYVEKRSANKGDSDHKPKRIAATQLDRIVRNAIGDFLRDPAMLTSRLELTRADDHAAIAQNASRIVQQLDHDFGTVWGKFVRPILQSIVLQPGSLTLRFEQRGLCGMLGVADRNTENDRQAGSNALVDFDIPLTIQTRGTRLKLVLRNDDRDTPGKPDSALVKAIARAHDWFNRLTSGQAPSIQAITKSENLTPSYVTRVLRLAFLAPDLTETILDGRQAFHITADRLTLREDLPMDWEQQRARFTGRDQ